ncbi:DUF1524 domain-containing protein [Cellulomonas sp. KRMCY2]|uniref:HNH endonuclease family protein n=1 Tax=Cellulomonas sp. KRMCY2 TaxID=1304865 RepID=UPI00045EAD9C
MRARDLFGNGWVDVDRNGCDPRNDMLERDLEPQTFKPGTHDCVVLTGVLNDPYSATTIQFTRVQDTSNDVQIDHVVALSDAWQKGAQQDATIDILAADLMLDSVGDRPSDLAVWDDWISCVAKVKAGGGTPLRWSAVE